MNLSNSLFFFLLGVLGLAGAPAQKSLEAPSLGVVADAQGIVLVRPMAGGRATPIRTGTPLQPGDWVQTETRGANAAQLRLQSGAVITLGPGSVLHLKSDEAVTLSGRRRLCLRRGGASR